MFDPADLTSALDPHPAYRELREKHPLYFCAERELWLLSRHADVTAALADPATFSSARGVIPSGFVPAKPTIITLDPPAHTRLRKAVQRAFTPRRVAALEPRVREIAARQLDALSPDAPADLVAALNQPLPIAVISELLGVEIEDRARFQAWSDAIVQSSDGASPELQRAEAELLAYLEGVFPERRRRPRDDLVSLLLRASPDGEALSDDELLGFCFILLVAGSETTTAALGNAAALLEAHPALRARLCAEPALWKTALEELLRLDPPVQGLSRVLTREVALHGRRLPAGARVHLLFAAANRDERVFPQPDRLDPSREPNPHLGFGQGVHFCLGASLARLELRVALGELLARWPHYRIDRSALARLPSDQNRGYRRLPVALAPDGAAAVRPGTPS